MQNRLLREDNNLPIIPGQGRWSGWRKAMVPDNTDSSERFLSKRGPNQRGFMWSNIENALADVGRLCGIYEWKATRAGQPDRVVYVGSTCTRNEECQRLKSRIIRYCKYGNHKKDHINHALRNGYELYVRYKEASNEDEAKEMENELLYRYDYAWNERRNDVIRYILPPL